MPFPDLEHCGTGCGFDSSEVECEPVFEGSFGGDGNDDGVYDGV